MLGPYMHPFDPIIIIGTSVTIANAEAGVERWLLVIVQQVVPLVMLAIVAVVVMMLMFELHLHPARETEEDSLSTS